MSKKEITFENAMERLEEIVNLLESGDSPLDKSLSLFEEGVKLVKLCNEKIEKTVEKTAPAAPKAPIAPKEETAPIVEEPAAKVEETEDFKIVVNEEKAPEVNEEPVAQEEKKTGFFGRFFARK